MRDEDILDLYWQRNEEALEATAGKYGPSLLRLAENMVLREDAQECVNDTYLAAWSHIPPDRPRYFFAWLAKVCRNFALSRIEWNQAAKRRAEIVTLSDELQQCIPDRLEQEAADVRELGRLLSIFLRRLSEEKRIVFLRRYWYGDSIREIAEARQCGESRIKTMLHRTRTGLREYLEKEGIVL